MSECVAFDELELARKLLDRLWKACARLPDFGGDLWSRGMFKIQEKTHSLIWLSSFRPEGGMLVEDESPTQEVTIQFTDNTK